MEGTNCAASGHPALNVAELGLDPRRARWPGCGCPRRRVPCIAFRGSRRRTWLRNTPTRPRYCNGHPCSRSMRLSRRGALIRGMAAWVQFSKPNRLVSSMQRRASGGLSTTEARSDIVQQQVQVPISRSWACSRWPRSGSHRYPVTDRTEDGGLSPHGRWPARRVRGRPAECGGPCRSSFDVRPLRRRRWLGSASRSPGSSFAVPDRPPSRSPGADSPRARAWRARTGCCRGRNRHG